ncbi:MAG: zinc ribbon domain-containing protein [Candidatus Eiseniibacteriota bacterium]|jgi:putative FmdB family regulatory protein
MPTYDYKCLDCGHTFEVFQSITADKLETCPRCGGSVERLIGAGAGLLFKGSGFYITDYRSTSYRKAAKAERGGGGEASGTSKGSSGGDSSTASDKGPSKGGGSGSGSSGSSGSST